MDAEILCSLQRIECLLRNLLGQGYGDAIDSKSGTKTLTATYQPIVTAPRVCLLWLANTHATVNIEISPNQDETVTGGVLAANRGVVLDRFIGTLYARGNTGTLNYLMMPWSIDLSSQV